jgi:hypothetical protein
VSTSIVDDEGGYRPPAAAAAPPVIDAHAVARAPARCRNCDAVAPDRYCPNCGQATALHPPTVREFTHELLQHHVAFDGSLWRTLKALLLKPGSLTADYFAGRRTRYIAPLRLYLTFSLILFALAGLGGSGTQIAGGMVQFKVPDKTTNSDIVIGPSDLRGKMTGIGFIDRALRRMAAMTIEERTARVNAGVRQYLPYVLIVLVPVLALYLKLLYRNRRRLYGEHLVVAFHAQTVAFIFAIVSTIPSDALQSVLFFVLLAQTFIALRRVYGGRVLPTLVREAALLAGYGVTVLAALVATVMLSLVV